MSVGTDLLNVPFPQMVRSLAMAIADGQRSLDKVSVETARFLAEEKVALIEEMWEVIEPQFHDVQLGDGSTIRVTGATVSADHSAPVPFTLLQAGLFPT